MNPRVSTLLVLLVVSLASGAHQAGNPEAEYAQLIQQQTQFQNQLNLIESDLAATMGRLKSTSSTSEKVGLMESQIAKQRQLVFSSTKTLLPAVNLTKCSCQNLSPDQKQAVINELNSVRNNIVTLQKDLNSAPVCNRTRSMYEDLNSQLYFVDNMVTILRSRCTQRAILSPTVWQTNLNAQNWILGEQTLDDVIEEYYQRAITYDNITNCDIKTPFFSNGKCINCPKAQPVFNLYTSRCESCGKGLIFDGQRRKCVPGDSAGSECPKGTYLDGKTGACIRLINCNANQFFNGTSKRCQQYVQCTDQWLNRKTNKCEKFLECSGSWLDKVNNECIPFKECPTGFHINRITNWCDKIIVCNNQFFNQETLKCEPYATCNGQQEFLDRGINKCVPYQQCTDGTLLNKVTNQCVPKPQCDPAKEIYSPMFGKCVSLKQCAEGEVLNKEFNQCEPCRNGVVDKATGECVPCKDGEKFDAATRQCARACAPELVLNLGTKQCVQKPKIFRLNEQAATKVIQGKVTLDQYQNQIEKVIRANPLATSEECPADKPYSLLTTCTACEGSFVLDSQECGNCPEGTSFNPDTRSCRIALFLTDASGKLDLGGLSLHDFEAWQNNNVHRNPNAVAQTCPKETPYSVGGTKCIACQGDQAFDLATNSCKPCPNYNGHKCD